METSLASLDGMEESGCHCGARFTVMFTGCGQVTCPECGSMVKVGACGG